MWPPDCPFAHVGGLQHAGYVLDLGCSSLTWGRSSWISFARPNRGSRCTGNRWDCRLFLVNLALQSQLPPVLWVDYLWLQHVDTHAGTHKHTHLFSSAQRTSRSTWKISPQPFHSPCIALGGRGQGKMLQHKETTAISHFQSHYSQVSVLAVHRHTGWC